MEFMDIVLDIFTSNIIFLTIIIEYVIIIFPFSQVKLFDLYYVNLKCFLVERGLKMIRKGQKKGLQTA